MMLVPGALTGLSVEGEFVLSLMHCIECLEVRDY